MAVDADEDPSAVFIEVEGYGSGLSGLARRYDVRHFDRINTKTKRNDSKGAFIKRVPTVKLDTLLDKHSLHNIDLCSLKVEGAELSILKSINWEKTHIKILLVENYYSNPEFRRYLESVGFQYQTTIVDEVYVN